MRAMIIVGLLLVGSALALAPAASASGCHHHTDLPDGTDATVHCTGTLPVHGDYTVEAGSPH